jgi:tetratricopeptide (TPR) repeat protein
MALFEGRLDDAAALYRRGVDEAGDDRAVYLINRCCVVLALGYAGDPTAAAEADALLADVGDAVTAYAAYAWYVAGEVDLDRYVDRARARYERAIELAERSGAAFVTGVAGASKASLEARHGDPAVAAAEYTQLLLHWRRAGMWSTQWTMLRSVAVLLEVLGRHREAAVLVGAIRTTPSGHRIFGADELALADLEDRLRRALGDDAYDAAATAGAVLDDDAAVEHALRSL